MAWNTSENKQPVSLEELHKIFKPAVDLKVDTGLKMGIHSRSKMGKTHFCASAWRPGYPLYVMDTEGNMIKEVKRMPIEAQREIFIAEVMLTDDEDAGDVDLTKSLESLEAAMKMLLAVIQSGQAPHGMIIVDSATDPWSWLGSWLEDVGQRTKAGTLSRLEWGRANKRYTQFMYKLLTSKWDVTMTFRSAPAVNDKGQDLGYDKARWQKDTEYWLDLIMEITHDGVHRNYTFKGDRFGGINGTLQDADYMDVVKHIEEESGVVLIHDGDDTE